MTASTRKFKNAKQLLDHALQLQYFDPQDKGGAAIPVHRVDGTGNFVLVLGENASGKSFLRRILGAICHENKIEYMPLSMEGRGDTFGGLRGMVYGDESWRSTGENSSHTVLMGIKTCQGRETPHVIMWDEPDIGLSDSWAAGMGVTFRKFAENLPKTTYGAFVVTHSRALVEQLLPVNPTYLHIGSKVAPVTLKDWLDRPIRPRNLEELGHESHTRFKRIQTILNLRKKEASEAKSSSAKTKP